MRLGFGTICNLTLSAKRPAYRACLAAQASVRATRTSSPSWLWTSPQATRKILRQSTGKILRPSCSGGSAEKRGEQRARRVFRRSDEKRSLRRQRRRAGNRMTAEVALLNKSAVALAADSTVTVGPDGSSKTYDTVNKLFTLSKYHPIGIMIYGNAEFMRHPWETIIKTYRESCGKTPQDTVEKYAAHFCNHLQNFTVENELVRQNTLSIVSSLFYAIKEDVDDVILDADLVNIGEIRVVLKAAVLAELSALKNIPQILTKTEADVIADYGAEIEHGASVIFGKWINSQIKQSLVNLATAQIIKRRFSRHRSGIVFAGFGDTEFFPHLREFSTDGVVMGELKIAPSTILDISPLGTQASIVPFAVRDMVDRFMEGVDRRYQQWINRTVRNLFEANSLSIVEKYVTAPKSEKSKIKSAVKRAIAKNTERFFADERKYRAKNFIDPVVNMLDLLPKEELAELAESLIHLTSLKKRITMEVESVGGPIDVAVISKGDGFIWVKRKHYFQPDLNQSFIRNYLRG